MTTFTVNSLVRADGWVAGRHVLGPVPHGEYKYYSRNVRGNTVCIVPASQEGDDSDYEGSYYWVSAHDYSLLTS